MPQRFRLDKLNRVNYSVQCIKMGRIVPCWINNYSLTRRGILLTVTLRNNIISFHLVDLMSYINLQPYTHFPH